MNKQAFIPVIPSIPKSSFAGQHVTAKTQTASVPISIKKKANISRHTDVSAGYSDVMGIPGPKASANTRILDTQRRSYSDAVGALFASKTIAPALPTINEVTRHQRVPTGYSELMGLSGLKLDTVTPHTDVTSTAENKRPSYSDVMAFPTSKSSTVAASVVNSKTRSYLETFSEVSGGGSASLDEKKSYLEAMLDIPFNREGEGYLSSMSPVVSPKGYLDILSKPQGKKRDNKAKNLSTIPVADSRDIVEKIAMEPAVKKGGIRQGVANMVSFFLMNALYILMLPVALGVRASGGQAAWHPWVAPKDCKTTSDNMTRKQRATASYSDILGIPRQKVNVVTSTTENKLRSYSDVMTFPSTTVNKPRSYSDVMTFPSTTVNKPRSYSDIMAFPTRVEGAAAAKREKSDVVTCYCC